MQRKVRKIHSGHLTILLYHGVTDAHSEGIENYSGKHCSREEFVKQMAFLKANCNLLSMDDVVNHYKAKKPFPKNSAAVTFDDGFKNNFTVAVPVLDNFRIPAAFYLSTGFIGTEKMFWVDIMEDCINRSKKRRIELDISARRKKFLLATAKQRIQALEAVKKYCKQAGNEKKDVVVRSVIAATGIRPSVHSAENYRKMSWDDAAEISANPLFTVGGHTQNHTILSSLSVDAMKREISVSIRELKKRLGSKVRHYSYPEGQKNHYNENTIAYLKKCGIVCCPSAIDGVNTFKDDLFHLKRIMVAFRGRKFPFKGYNI